MQKFFVRHFIKFAWCLAVLSILLPFFIGYEVLGSWIQPGRQVVAAVMEAKAGDLGGNRKYGEIVVWNHKDRQARSRASLRYGARKLFRLTTESSGVKPLCGVREGSFVAFWECGKIDIAMALSFDSDGSSNLNWSRTDSESSPVFEEVMDLETWLEKSHWGGRDSSFRALFRRCFPTPVTVPIQAK